MANRPFPSFLIYLDARGEYRWRCEAANGRTIADSGEGYKNYDDCYRMIGVVGGASGTVWQTDAVAARRR